MRLGWPEQAWEHRRNGGCASGARWEGEGEFEGRLLVWASCPTRKVRRVLVGRRVSLDEPFAHLRASPNFELRCAVLSVVPFT